MLPRVLVLILLALNVGVAVWWTFRPEPTTAPLIASQDPDTPSLRLLSEMDAAASAASDSVAGVPELQPSTQERQCWQIGPFLTQIDLRRAMNALAPLASRMQFRESREVIRRGFRVFLPSPGSREAALTLARRLSRRGITDYYVVTAGDEQNTVSLGLYREESNARNRLQEVSERGFRPLMEPRNEELPQFWIDIDLPQGLDWRAELGGYAGVGGNAIACAVEPANTPGPPG